MASALDELILHTPFLQDAVADVAEMEQRKERLSRAENDFPYFCKYYLPEYFTCPEADYQRILYDVIQTRRLSEGQVSRLRDMVPEKFRDYFIPKDDIKGIVDAEPRGHGKSTRMTFAFPLWLLLFKKSHFIIIIGAGKDDAQLQMSNIKQAVEGNEKIIEDFGFLKGKTWNKGFIQLANGCAVMCKGKGGALRGSRFKEHRPDLIIVDDTLKDEEADSSLMREKVCRWFSKTVLGLSDRALVVVVNTITNDDDLPSRILTEIKGGKKKGWIGLRFSAEMPPKEGEAHGSPLWPGRYSWDDLKNLQANLGSLAYAQEYLSEPLDEEDRLFRRSWIVRVRDTEIPQHLPMYEGIDPATGAHDMSAVVDIAKDRDTGKVYVVSSNGKKESTDTFTKRLISRYKLFKYRRAYMESQQFQIVYKKEVIRTAEGEGLHLPMTGKPSGVASKETRLMYLSPMIENGTIVFGPGNDMLIDQLVGFPAGGYDDLCDALLYAVQASESRGGVNSGLFDAKAARAGDNPRRGLKI